MRGFRIAVDQMTSGSKLPGLRTVVACAMIVITITVLARLVGAWALRTYFIEDASRDVGHIAAILADQAAKSVEMIDRSLAVLQERLVDLQPASADRSQPTFSAQMAGLPPTADFAIVDARGHVLDRSTSWPDASLDVSGHAFFVEHKAGHHGGLAISPDQTDGGGDAERLLFSRRVESRQGDFLGTVVIRIGADYFKPRSGTIAALTDVSFALLRTDGSILFRYPDPVNRAEREMPPQSPLSLIHI